MPRKNLAVTEGPKNPAKRRRKMAHVTINGSSYKQWHKGKGRKRGGKMRGKKVV